MPEDEPLFDVNCNDITPPEAQQRIKPLTRFYEKRWRIQLDDSVQLVGAERKSRPSGLQGCLLIEFLRVLGALAACPERSRRVPSFFARYNSETTEPPRRKDRKELCF
jgi:hypothetical protein